jgi:hypothetical protein
VAPEETRLKVQYLEIGQLVPYASNARTHSDAQLAQIAASIREFGWTNPVLLDGKKGVIAGHGRLLAAQRLGLKRVPCIELAHLTDAQKRAYIIADNQLALNAGWDLSLLSSQIQELQTEDFDLNLLGFDTKELSELLEYQSGTEGLTDPDEVPETPEQPVTKPGDLWLLGKHRLLCGDCRDTGSVSRLFAKTLANLVFTSPPYAEQRDYDRESDFRPISPHEYISWYGDVAANIQTHLAADGSYFLNIKPSCDGIDTHLYVFDPVLAHAREWGWHFATEFCWERNGVPKSVTQRFKNQFEPIYQFVRGRWKMRPDQVRHESPNVPIAGGAGVGQTSWRDKQGGRGVMSVSGSFGGAKKRRNGTTKFMADVQRHNFDPGEWVGPGLAYPGNRLPTFASTHEATGHVAAFPVGLPDFFIRAFTDIGDAVYDPFVGSGSTIIAAERTSRNCHAVELSPAYCDVIVTRWQNFTGKQATLDGTKHTFDQISEKRAA